MHAYHRDYPAIANRLAASDVQAPMHRRMQLLCDALWDGLHDHGVSWVGFYLDEQRPPEPRRLVLGPCRDKPACSPIGLHGVCGQALLSRHVQIVRDVAELREQYVPCDPRDRSEIVIPLIDQQRSCYGVLDLDSWQVAAFDDADAAGLINVLRVCNLTQTPREPIVQGRTEQQRLDR